MNVRSDSFENNGYQEKNQTPRGGHRYAFSAQREIFGRSGLLGSIQRTPGGTCEDGSSGALDEERRQAFADRQRDFKEGKTVGPRSPRPMGTTLKIDILTLFPGMFESFVSESIVKRAIEKKIVTIRPVDLRDFTHDRHRSCDDKPFGGGPGMLMRPEPIFEAYEKVIGKKECGFRFIYLTPTGKRFDQKKAVALGRFKHLVFLCGHYEGVDQRVVDELVTDEISVGDYVLTGGELPVMVVIDAVVRLLKGVLGDEQSKVFESFTQNLLEYPQYTRPGVYRGFKVPSVLLSGDHQKIAGWRQKQARQLTLKRRPDLLKRQLEKRGIK